MLIRLCLAYFNPAKKPIYAKNRTLKTISRFHLIKILRERGGNHD